MPQGEPQGADGYIGQQGGEAAQPNRLCRLPSLLADMGGRGQLREGSLTSCMQPIADYKAAMHQYTYINLNLLFYKPKFVYLHRTKIT